MPAELTTVVLDCADPAALAAFYAKALGWEVTSSDDDTVQLGGGPVGLGFQRVAGYRGPAWPDAAKHAHLDLRVGDLAGAVEEFLTLGATKPDFQPGGGDWTVLQDPEGHLFCLAEG
ncbi:VOC family protein [Amycolatopsis sp. NPDC051716]|uniref:VOC family protein n=1 Tax=Amycolatopsis sp. NPDC051716 TaxID=3155804 RepID=UPI003440F005